jgi:cytochrome c oxidase cbb3-type subunit 2
MDAVFGRPTVAADYARLEPLSWFEHTPGVLGSERTGPDLSNVARRRPSEAWHLIHLYDPRAVSPWSVMPRYRNLFAVVDEPAEGDTLVPIPPAFAPANGKVVAKQAALDLVSYLLSLEQAGISGQPAEPAGNVQGGEGERLYVANCAACHQANGKGVAATFPPLAGNAVVNAADPSEHIDTVLHGVQGKTIGGIQYAVAMPPFGTLLGDAEVAAILNHERSSWGNQGSLVTAEQVASRRKRGASP